MFSNIFRAPQECKDVFFYPCSIWKTILLLKIFANVSFQQKLHCGYVSKLDVGLIIFLSRRKGKKKQFTYHTIGKHYVLMVENIYRNHIRGYKDKHIFQTHLLYPLTCRLKPNRTENII